MLLTGDDRTMAVVITLIGLIALEGWRRTLRNRAPRWVHAVMIGLFVIIGAGVAYSELALRRIVDTFDDLPANEKATTLATAISKALNGYAIAVVATLVVLVVLVVATVRVRRLPEGGPVARARR